MNLLYFWRSDNYRRDRRFGFGYHLNQNSPAVQRVAPGESVWAFTRNGLGHYVLAAELVVRAVTRNPPGYRYGSHRVWGDLESSRYFEIDGSPNAEPLIRKLSIEASSPLLGRSFQGHAAVRPLAPADNELLFAFASDLRVVERVAIYPEDEFEARLYLGEAARTRLVAESRPEYASRTRYLHETVDITRARRHVEWLQQAYAGRCQICRFDPRERYDRSICQGHHIHWLSRGGDDELENMMLVCPNHHRAIHSDDAVFDYGSLSFFFSNGLHEPVVLNSHLPQAS